jgi:hypothetical protein
MTECKRKFVQYVLPYCTIERTKNDATLDFFYFSKKEKNQFRTGTY